MGVPAETPPEKRNERDSNPRLGRVGRQELIFRLNFLSDAISQTIAELEKFDHDTGEASKLAALARRRYLKELIAGKKVQELEELVASGELISGAQLAKQRGVGRSTITQAHNSNRLFRLKLGRKYLYPSFFGDKTLDQANVEKVARALGKLPEFHKLHFFQLGKESLNGRSPIEALRDGDVEKVVEAARARGETSGEQ